MNLISSATEIQNQCLKNYDCYMDVDEKEMDIFHMKVADMPNIINRK